MTRINKAPLVLGMAAVLALAGCSASAQTPDGVSPSAVALGQAKYAIYLSPPSSELDPDVAQGKLLLVEGNGTYQKLETWGMDYGQLAWNEGTLSFSDTKNDYRINDQGLTTIFSPKTDSQNSLLSVGRDSAVGVYNDGFTDTGYVSQIVTAAKDDSSLIEAEGNYNITANCAGVVYGASRATGKYSKSGDPDTEPMMFSQLTGTTNGTEVVLGTSDTANEGAVAPDAPCVGGHVYYISNASPSALGNTPKPVLSSWNIKTGTYGEVVLKGAPDQFPLMRDDGTGLPQVDSSSIRDGSLEWFGAGNAILSTDISTGKTVRKFEVEGHTDNSAGSKVIFTPTEVVQLVDNNDGSDFRVIHYDRESGREVSRTDFKGLAAELSDSHFVRGFAVRP